MKLFWWNQKEWSNECKITYHNLRIWDLKPKKYIYQRSIDLINLYNIHCYNFKYINLLEVRGTTFNYVLTSVFLRN